MSYRLRSRLRDSSFFSKKNLERLVLLKPRDVLSQVDKNSNERASFIVGGIPYDLGEYISNFSDS